MMRYYAGIGSRKTPENILREMTRLAGLLSERGYVLRSGGAEGADTAFEEGSDCSDIYVPWPTYYRNRRFAGVFTKIHVLTESPRYSAALALAKKHHPRWENCSEGAKKLLARNGMQILGGSLADPSDFVICWTPDGKFSGGTGQALRLAEASGIEIFNLHSPEDRAKLEVKISGLPVLTESELEALYREWHVEDAIR